MFKTQRVKKDVVCISTKTEENEKRVDKLYTISGVFGWIIAVGLPAIAILFGFKKNG